MENGITATKYVSERVAVIVINRNRLSLLKECIKYLEESGDRELFDLYIVDSCSIDGSRQWLLHNVDANLIFDQSPNLGYSESNNRVIKMCRSYKYLYLVNNDLFVCKHWLREAIKCAERHPEAGHIASKQLSADYTIQAAGAF